MAEKTKDEFTKNWIIANALQIVQQYEKGVLTLRALHYQLVSCGMTNDIQHYKRVVSAMIDARWKRYISFDTFSDLDRSMVGFTEFQETVLEDEIITGKQQIQAWIHNFHKKRWENQSYYPEVFIEKKALQGVFQKTCQEWDVALGACKGYPSLTFLYESYQRFLSAVEAGKCPIIIYFGDYDPSGEDIPRSIQDNIMRFANMDDEPMDIEVRRIALMKPQVIAWKLPPAPAKLSDARTANWDGLGQVELDAVRPERLIDLLKNALLEIFDQELYDKLLKEEATERAVYQSELKQYANNI